MNPNILFSGLNNLLIGLTLIGIIILLFYESINDIKYRIISKKGVIILYLLTPTYVYLTQNNLTQPAMTFLFTLLIFLLIWIFSFKQFGIGDALTISAIGWILGDFNTLQNFLFILGILCIPWGIYWTVHYLKMNDYKDILTRIKTKLPIYKLKPGMVLADDGFMHGLTEKDIEKMRLNGKIEVEIKQPLPLIPCVFLAFILTLI